MIKSNSIMGKNKIDLRSAGMRFIKSIWLFPILLLLLLCILTALRISGTSAGVYHQALYGENVKDPSLIAGKPQTIRSDEWLFITQMTIAQSNAGFPHINENIGEGRDMSVVIDVPYLEWSTIFKPQNLIFFILPLENAFAFKWWSLLFLLIVSCYFFILRVFPKKRLFASILAIAIGCSPFVFWWYQTVTIAPLFYGFFILILGMRIINGEKIPILKNKNIRYSYALYTIALAYLLVSFGLLMYPPFQIPVALVVAFFLLGYTLQQRFTTNTASTKTLLKRLGVFLAAGIISVMLIGTFLLTRSDAVHAVQNTIYPGSRTVESGGLPPSKLMSGFLQPQLQREERVVHYQDNQSEASNFILLLPFLLLPGLFLIIYEYKKTKKIDWLFVCINIVALIFLMRVFVPGLNLPSSLLQLNSIPHKRLFVGIGFIGILQLLYLMQKLSLIKYNRKLNVLIIAYIFACLLLSLFIGYRISNDYPEFISNRILIGGLAVLFTSIVAGILYKKYLLAASLLLILSVASVYKVHPIYQGLGVLVSNDVKTSMDSLSNKNSTWAVADDIYYENFGLINNHDSITGIQFYPDLTFWKGVDTQDQSKIYNRYAHIVFNSSPDLTQKVRLTRMDVVQVTLTCDRFIQKNVDYLLSTQKINKPCVQEIKKITYPNVTFYIYKMN